MAKSTCGQHTELVSTNAVKVTRCTCGAVHLTVLASGVTLRLNTESFRGLALGLGVALEKLEEPPPITATGSTSIN